MSWFGDNNKSNFKIKSKKKIIKKEDLNQNEVKVPREQQQ